MRTSPTCRFFHIPFWKCVFSYCTTFTLRAQLNCIKLGAWSRPSWQWVMGIKAGSAYMVMATFTGTINHLSTASSLIPHRMEGKERAGQVKNKQLLPLSLVFSLSTVQLSVKSFSVNMMKCGVLGVLSMLVVVLQAPMCNIYWDLLA